MRLIHGRIRFRRPPIAIVSSDEVDMRCTVGDADVVFDYLVLLFERHPRIGTARHRVRALHRRVVERGTIPAPIAGRIRELLKTTTAAGQARVAVVVPDGQEAATDVDVRVDDLVLEPLIDVPLPCGEDRYARRATIDRVEDRDRRARSISAVRGGGILILMRVDFDRPRIEEQSELTLAGSAPGVLTSSVLVVGLAPQVAALDEPERTLRWSRRRSRCRYRSRRFGRRRCRDRRR